MKVKDVLAEVAYRMGREDLASYFKNYAAGGESTAEEKELLSYYNETEKKIAVEIFPLFAEQTFSSNGEIAADEFSKELFSVLRVENRAGESVNFTSFPTFVRVPKGTVKVYYRYLPEDKEFESDLEAAFAVPLYAMVAGVLSKFYLARGMLKESAVWNREFYSLLSAAKEKCGEKRKIRGRKWC